MQIELELLAPAKNKDIGITAINCGADAVYIAGPRFGARESAGNAISDIAELVSYARRYRAKVYITVNTILYDNELDQAAQIIRQAYEAGCDAVIVQDLALLKTDLPPIPLFASTQTNIRTPAQAQFLESLGFKRLILARELSLEQIRAIRQSVQTDLEAFVHGALCVSYSGQCYLSQRLTCRSANRGACAQACRSLYTLTDYSGKVLLKDAPVLSLKDLNLSNRIPELVQAGITSFKIEGRLKNNSYIKNTVKLYREQIDRFLSSNPNYTRASLGNLYNGFTPNPYRTFNRGYTQLFIDGHRGKWRSVDGAKYLGEPIGRVIKSEKDKQGFLRFTYVLDSSAEQTMPVTPLVNGDGLCFVTPKGEISGARANYCNGQTVTTTERSLIPVESKVYRNYNIAFEKEMEKNMPQRLIPIELIIKNRADGVPVILATSPERPALLPTDLCSLPVEGELTPATNISLAKQNLFTQLSKTTDLFKFELTNIAPDVTIPFLPVSQINEFRRILASKIKRFLEADLQKEKQKNSTRPEPSAAETDKSAGTSGQEKKDMALSDTLNYLANCSNKLSALLYKEKGVKNMAPAYELAPVPQAELMRTKYCIKYELGLCPHYKRTAKNDPDYVNKIPEQSLVEPFFLLNGKNKLQLKFDCTHCEMLIIG